MVDFAELGLIEEEAPAVDVGSLPEFGDFSLPQPGSYIFKLPGEEILGDNRIYTLFPTEAGQRVRVQFKRIRNEEKTETLVDSSLVMPNNAGKKFSTSVSSQERKFGDVLYSDFAALLQALGFKGAITNTKSYILALEGYPKALFQAVVDWSGSCNPQADAYGEDSKKIPGKKGCGRQYRTYTPKKQPTKPTSLIPKYEDESGQPTNEFAEKFQCLTQGCPAWVRVFGNLKNFTSVR